jgi:hypothetical protein
MAEGSDEPTGLVDTPLPIIVCACSDVQGSVACARPHTILGHLGCNMLLSDYSVGSGRHIDSVASNTQPTWKCNFTDILAVLLSHRPFGVSLVEEPGGSISKLGPLSGKALFSSTCVSAGRMTWVEISGSR